MKNFKRLGTILLSAFVLFCFLSCDKELDQLGADRERIPVNGQIEADHVSFFINAREASNIEESFLYGHGFLDSNESLKVSAEQHHVTYYETESSVQIECGQFTYTLGNGDHIFGDYCGCGDYCDSNVSVEMVLNITGGTGMYKGANGNISATVNRDIIDENKMHILSLKGSILLAK